MSSNDKHRSIILPSTQKTCQKKENFSEKLHTGEKRKDYIWWKKE